MAEDQGGAKNLADFLAATFQLTRRQVHEFEDSVEVAASLSISCSLLRHLGRDEYADKLRQLGIALALDREVEALSPEMNQAATMMLQTESKRRREREHEG